MISKHIAPFFDSAHKFSAPFKVTNKEKNRCSGAALILNKAANSSSKNITLLPDCYVAVTPLEEAILEHQTKNTTLKRVKAFSMTEKTLKTETVDTLMNYVLDAHTVAGCHIELEINSDKLKKYRQLLFKFPALCITLTDFSKAHLGEIFLLAEQGVRIKTCSFSSRNCNHGEQAQILAELHAINHNALMYGSNAARESVITHDTQLITSIFDKIDARRILIKNAEHFYRIGHSH